MKRNENSIAQTNSWVAFTENLKWKSYKIKDINIYYRRLLKYHTFVKIQSPPFTPDIETINELRLDLKANVILYEPNKMTGSDQLKYLKNGFFLSPIRTCYTSTVVINLHNYKYPEGTRRNIKKAMNHQLEFKMVEPNEITQVDFDNFWSLYKLLSDEKDFSSNGKTYFVDKFEKLKNISYFSYIIKNGVILNCVWWTRVANKIFYTHVGCLPESYQLSANYLLVHNVIEWAKNNLIDALEFEAISDPRFKFDLVKAKGYSEFKKRWGGQVIHFPWPLVWTKSRIMKFVLFFYTKYIYFFKEQDAKLGLDWEHL